VNRKAGLACLLEHRAQRRPAMTPTYEICATGISKTTTDPLTYFALAYLAAAFR